MPLKVTELFGYPPGADQFNASLLSRDCPFIGSPCRKFFSDGMPSGLCSASATKTPMPVICCPQRLYANDYEILRRVSAAAFGTTTLLMTNLENGLPSNGGVIPFGQRMGKELKVQSRGTSYAFDWILASVDGNGELIEFVAVEVQTIDTTGSYRRQSWELQMECGSPGMEKFTEPAKGKSSNFNFENVSKRILPQLITKGHLFAGGGDVPEGTLLRVSDSPVLNRIYTRLGNHLAEYSLQPGSITFHDYTLDITSEERPLPLKFGSSFTTTHDQLAMAFSSPQNLPPKNSYSAVVREAVKARLQT